VAKVLSIIIQITFEQSAAILAHCLKKFPERKHECPKICIYIFVYITVDVNKISVLAAGLSIRVLRVTLQSVKETQTVTQCMCFSVMSFVLQTDKRS
jgi:hypothetical protein